MTHRDAEEFGSAPNEPHDPQGRPVKGKLKTYEVSFIPSSTLQYNYVVEAKDEDEAYYKAQDELRFDLGYDKAKDFNCNKIQESDNE